MADIKTGVKHFGTRAYGFEGNQRGGQRFPWSSLSNKHGIEGSNFFDCFPSTARIEGGAGRRYAARCLVGIRCSRARVRLLFFPSTRRMPPAYSAYKQSTLATVTRSRTFQSASGRSRRSWRDAASSGKLSGLLRTGSRTRCATPRTGIRRA